MDAPLRVALDVTPLAGEPTGIARAINGVIHALCADPSLAVSGWMLSGRRRAHPSGVPSGVPVHHCPVPAQRTETQCSLSKTTKIESTNQKTMLTCVGY